MTKEIKDKENLETLKNKLVSLVDKLTLVKSILCVRQEDEEEIYVYLLDEQDNCMCLPFSVLNEFIKKYKGKGQKDIMVI